jgi:hypothetical protein
MMETISEEQHNPARDRISRLFKFVGALYAQRNPANKQLSDQERIGLPPLDPPMNGGNAKPKPLIPYATRRRRELAPNALPPFLRR